MVAIHEKSPGTLRILVIRPSALGDTLLLAPALYQLAHEVELIVAGRRPGIDFLEPLADTCLDYEKGGWHTLFSEKPDCSNLPSLDLDGVISFLADSNGDASKGLQACFQGIPVHCFRPFPHKEEKLHVARYLAQCLNDSGLPVNPDQAISEARRKPLLRPKDQEKAGHMVVLHPGAGSERKNYPLEFWLDLMRGTWLELFHKKIVLLGPAEGKLHERFEKERRHTNTEIIRCPRKEGLRSLLTGAALYIGHDSGITHLSALLGTPTIALFRDSHLDQWSPLGLDVTVIAHSSNYHAIFERIREKIRQSIRHL
jgi:heptosyltransferase-3